GSRQTNAIECYLLQQIHGIHRAGYPLYRQRVHESIHGSANDSGFGLLSPPFSIAKPLDRAAYAQRISQNDHQEEHGKMTPFGPRHIVGESPVHNSQFSPALIVQEIAGMRISMKHRITATRK